MRFMDTVNAEPWKGVPAGKALVVQFETSTQLENNVSFMQCTLGIACTFRAWGWKRRVIDQGYYKKTAIGGGAYAWERIRDKDTGMPRTDGASSSHRTTATASST